MGKFAEGASGAGENTARNWQRGATRRAILEAARLIAARDPNAEISLNNVAKEAGYSTTTVFAYFQTKDELFNAIVADDLAALARQMRDSYRFASDHPVEQTEAVAAQPAAPSADANETIERERATVVTLIPQTEARPDETAKPPRADAWLERRLRVFEKALADVETRLSAAQQDSSNALSVVEEHTTTFAARLTASEKRAAELSNDLTARLSAAEKRLRETHGELRNSLLNASMRIDALEADAKRIAAGVTDMTVPKAEPVLEAVTEAAVPEAQPNPVAADSYLSAARRAAQTAATLSAMETRPRAKSAKHFWFNRGTAVLAAALAVLFVLGALIAYAVGEQAGRAVPVRTTALSAHAMVIALATPPADPVGRTNAGDARAALAIGLRYLKGHGVAPNQTQAVHWIAKAAHANDPLAQYWMGEVYAHGDGVRADAGKALRWYAAAAGHGNREAMYVLGDAYAQGRATSVDFVQAAHWFAKAAALGLTDAQFNLAVLYERGEGVPQSLSNAYQWYAIAAASGDAESAGRIEAIATQLTPNTLAAAKAAAAAFTPGLMDRDANIPPEMDIPPRA